MLHCVYHFNGEIATVEDDEKERLLQLGTWFDHPTKAKDHKLKLESELIGLKKKKMSLDKKIMED